MARRILPLISSGMPSQSRLKSAIKKLNWASTCGQVPQPQSGSCEHFGYLYLRLTSDKAAARASYSVMERLI